MLNIGDKSRRRATILLMVVSLLALLFVIVTGYLSLARFERQTFGTLHRGADVDRVVASANELIRSRMREQWLDPRTGRLLAAPGAGQDTVAREDIPGYGGSNWLAGPLIVDAGSPPLALAQLYANLPAPYNQLLLNRYAAVTSLKRAYGANDAPELPIQSRLAELLLDGDESDLHFRFADLASNARAAFMDADGDGIPDSDFAAVADLTDLANAIAGAPVPAPRQALEIMPPIVGQLAMRPFRPYRLVDPNNVAPGEAGETTFDEQWALYNRFARYELAARVVSHGGMLSLSAPGAGNSKSWNRLFAARLFNCIERDGGTLGENEDALFDAIFGQAAAIDALLRRRGGALPSWMPDGQSDRLLAAVPEPLRILEGRFRATFDLGSDGANFSVNRTHSWQRFNLTRNSGSPSDRDFWRALAAKRVNPEWFNGAQVHLDDNVNKFDRRQLLTALNNSDDLARRQRKDADPNAANYRDQPGLHHGQTKFYLGEAANAFHPNGVYRSSPADPNGVAITRRLAAYYYDMLSGHQYDPNLPNEVDSAFEQAHMLAVNTVQAAAPRGTGAGLAAGFIDVVTLQVNDPLKPGNDRRYIGYGPQPFISQVTLHDRDDNPTTENLELLVELYNPNDPTDYNNLNNDAHALFMPQFGISVNDQFQGLVGFPQVKQMIVLDQTIADANRQINVNRPPNLGAANRFPGRTFTSISINGTGNTSVFEGLTDSFGQRVTHSAVRNYPVQLAGPSGDDWVTVKLWKRNAGLEWFQVDEFRVLNPVRYYGRDPNDEWTVVAWRDMNAERYFRSAPNPAGGTFPPLAGRWRMAAAWEPDPNNPNDPANPYTGNVVSFTGFNPDQGIGAPAVAFRNTVSRPEPDVDDVGFAAPRTSPTVPLYTMNATPINPALRNQLVVHGSRRPESFPTVGFLAFVPRFSHVQAQVSGAPATARWPMSRLLREFWFDNGGSGPYSLTGYPADFGHMPFFDNRQSEEGNAYMNVAGRVPWGQLVFDYFTTIDPAGPDGLPGTADDIDPLRIGGRININTADWYTLAQLPLIGPNGDPNGAPIPIVAQNVPAENVPSLAFWNPLSGVLAGMDSDPTGPQRRFVAERTGAQAPSPKSLPQRRSDTGWWTLGPWLAQAAAAYRDGVPYVKASLAQNPASLYHRAFARNSGNIGDPEHLRPYRNTTYGQPRGNDPNSVLALGPPLHYGFLTIGELANVVGFDSTPGDPADPAYMRAAATPNDYYSTLGDGTSPRHGDYMKAVSLLALLDSHYLTTRSNTFTIYLSVMDRENPEASIRSQVTVDRSNLLPRLIHQDLNNNGLVDAGDAVTTVQRDGLPTVISQRRSAFYNARHDD